MTVSPLSRSLMALRAFVLLLLSSTGVRAASDSPGALDCAVHPCQKVLPDAALFRAAEGKPYFEGLSDEGKVIGWVALSTDLVDIKAYSGKPLVTLVGLNAEGIIEGAFVVSHSEPILLVGIPEKELFDFVAFYKDKSATERIVVGDADEGVISVDIISGATVTALAQNQTILETATVLGRGVGAIEARHTVSGRFVSEDVPWTWSQMWTQGVLGRLYVSQEKMGKKKSSQPFIDLVFTIADAPQVGIALLGQSEYDWYMGRLKEGEHLFIVLGNGTSSFKGSGFVRGGIFDRVRIEQGMSSLLFTDKDYRPLSGAAAPDSPSFKEGAVFITRGDVLDIGSPFDLVFIGSVYNHKGGFSRDFKTVSQTFKLPRSVYIADDPDPSQSIWRQAWRNSGYKKWVLGLVLLVVLGLFSFRRWTTGDQKRLRYLHLGFLIGSFFILGLVLRAQPSVTQIMTLVGGAVGEWRWELFLSEPLVFLFWIFIAIVSVIWGRGVFCGWLCPYGAMTELLFKVGEKLGLRHFELPDKIHERLRYFRYLILVVLLATYLYKPELGELMAEVEPFKSTFFVAPWTREIGFFAWWSLLILLSMVWWRPYCRYVCPLGAGLAIFGSPRVSGPYRRNFCSSCQICEKTCEPRAIRKDGTIDARECLSCMECEANFRDEEVCPPLIGIDRLVRKPESERSDRENNKLEQLRVQEKKI